MQISAASLLAAQQARTPSLASRATTQTAPAKQGEPESFRPLLFAAKNPDGMTPLDSSFQIKPGQATPFVRPGSQIDIKI